MSFEKEVRANRIIEMFKDEVRAQILDMQINKYHLGVEVDNVYEDHQWSGVHVHARNIEGKILSRRVPRPEIWEYCEREVRLRLIGVSDTIVKEVTAKDLRK